MKCEVEFLPVGDGEKGGDSIVIRYGEDHAYSVMVVDGGTLEAGEKMVEHIHSEFPQVQVIEHVVLTHADADHASGLRKLFGEFQIRHLWMHVPWLLALEARHLFQDKQIAGEDLLEKIRKEYDILSELWDLAEQYGTEIHYPFAGEQIGPFTVLSPTKATYLHLLPQFERTPEPDQAILEQQNMWIGKASPKNWLAKLYEKAISWAFESYDNETLRDGQTTSASNESSAILYGDFDGHRILLTGDAGINALWWACDIADQLKLQLQNFTFVQIPHHGSRNNVGPMVLNRLVGPIRPQDSERHFSAFASTPKDDSKHPRKVVLNAFHRRGARVSITQGGKKVYWGGFKPRANYTSLTPIPFSTQVEAYDD